jgi:hypothetical protein
MMSTPLARRAAMRPPSGYYGVQIRLARRIVEVLPPRRLSGVVKRSSW